MVSITQLHIRSITSAGRLFVITLSLASMFLVYDCNWLVENHEKFAFLIDFEKNEHENEELEVEIDKYVKDQLNIVDKQPVLKKRPITLHLNIPVSLYPDVTTPPPKEAIRLFFC